MAAVVAADTRGKMGVRTAAMAATMVVAVVELGKQAMLEQVKAVAAVAAEELQEAIRWLLLPGMAAMGVAAGGLKGS